MPLDFAALKAQVRQTVQDTMSTEAEYTSRDGAVTATLRIRWHNKISRVGDLLDTGYAEVIEGINRVIFNIPELTEKNVKPERGGQLLLTSPHFMGAVLILNAMEPTVGPIEEVWSVGHDR